MIPTRRSRHPLSVALAWLLSFALATGPASAQILFPPDNDPPPMEEPDNGGDSDDDGGILDSLDSGDSDSGDSDSGDSDDSDSDDSDSGDALLTAALVTLVVGGIYFIATESRDRDPVASRTAAEAMARLQKVEQVLEESAASQSALTVLDQRAADSRETLLTPEQRQQAMVVTASTAAGEQLAFTVDRQAAERAAGGPLFVQSLEAGWQVTGEGGVLSFVPNSRLLQLAGHRRLKNVAGPADPQDARYAP